MLSSSSPNHSEHFNSAKILKKSFPVLLAAGLFFCCDVAMATPVLRCEVTYAGSTQIVETKSVSDPYAVESVDIGGRFLFKAVMVGAKLPNAKPIDYIKLYVYFQGRHYDVPIHQATYLPPFSYSDSPTPLTPLNSLYAGEVERELQYHCTLQGAKP
ncbi:hypothetical protein AAKU64_000529 [Undibacterium sp. GrIS 1.8]